MYKVDGAQARGQSGMDQVGSTSIIYNPSMTDERFIEAISDFLQATNRTKRTNFEIGGVSFSLHKLFQIVSLSMGGFRKVTEGNRWVSVATSMGFPGTLENCKQFAMIYGTVLFPFEQHVISKIPLAKLSGKRDYNHIKIFAHSNYHTERFFTTSACA